MSNKILVLMALFVSLLCIVPIPSPLGGTPWNFLLLQAIPPPVALLLLLIPFILHRALVVAAQVSNNDRAIQQRQIREARAKDHLIFGSRYRDDEEGGTVWEIVNKNKFPWTETMLLIEKDLHGDKKTEKHKIGLLHGQQRLKIKSSLTAASTANWRVMAITDQGKVIDFPDEWLELEPFTPSLRKAS